MSNCFDVAKYILEKLGQITAMKLQKLVYYSQAWSLVWDEQELFDEKIQAWINGPVVPELYNFHKGQYKLTAKDMVGDSNNLTENQKDSIDNVLNYYGDKSPQWLSDLTHLEAPWRKARTNLAPNERGEEEITHEDMIEYYSSIEPDELENKIDG